MGEKRGRKPRGDERRDQDLHVRATKTQLDFLEILSYESEKSKTDIVWEALDYWYRNKKGRF